MGRIELESKPTQKTMDLCSTCQNADFCTLIKKDHEPVWECELFRSSDDSEDRPPFSEV